MNAAILVAGGTGERFGRARGKQLALLAGEPVAARSLRALARARAVDAIVVVCHPDLVSEFERIVASDVSGKVRAVVPGGETRRLSVAAGLAAVPGEAATVVVHDGARPLVRPGDVDAALERLGSSGADGVVVGHPAYDTVKVADATGCVTSTPDRASLWIAQTPQAFRADALRRAHDAAAADGFDGTDDASLVERLGGAVLMLEGPRWNLKITVPEDIAVAEALVRVEEAGD